MGNCLIGVCTGQIFVYKTFLSFLKYLGVTLFCLFLPVSVCPFGYAMRVPEMGCEEGERQRQALQEKILHLTQNALPDTFPALLFLESPIPIPITQEQARQFASLTLFGLPQKANDTGNHAVSSQGGMHFKVEGIDLNIAMEDKAYWLQHTLGLPGMTPHVMLLLQNIRVRVLDPGSQHLLTPDLLEGLHTLMRNDRDGSQIQTFLNTHPLCLTALKEELQRKFIQASHTIPGLDFDAFLESGDSLARLDPQTRCSLFIHTLLVSPGDAKGDNLKVTPEFQLISIDNDQLFEPTLSSVRMKGGRRTVHYPSVKSIFYCLPELLEQYLPACVREKLLAHSPFEMVTRWLHALEVQKTVINR